MRGQGRQRLFHTGVKLTAAVNAVGIMSVHQRARLTQQIRLRRMAQRPGQGAFHKNIRPVTNPGGDKPKTGRGQFQLSQRTIHRTGQTGCTVGQRTIQIKSQSPDVSERRHDGTSPARCACHQSLSYSQGDQK
ncbi:hypothetical protein D3C71_1593540 [compost metagenome]